MTLYYVLRILKIVVTLKEKHNLSGIVTCVHKSIKYNYWLSMRLQPKHNILNELNSEKILLLYQTFF